MNWHSGFDFAPEGDILLKTYYLPSPSTSQPSTRLTINRKKLSMDLWDVDYTPLRRLLYYFDPALMAPLETLISYVDEVEEQFKPRFQIISMDCVPNKANRVKVTHNDSWHPGYLTHLPSQMYGRPAEGSSWSDVWRGFTLNGKLETSFPEITTALSRLELLWNLLFPFARSHLNIDLDDMSRFTQSGESHRYSRSRRNPRHPSGGLLFYYSLVPGSQMVLPKIYLPVS